MTCRSCNSTLGATVIAVQYADGTTGLYCPTCAPMLVGLGRAIDNGRFLRESVRAGFSPKRRQARRV